MERARKPGEWIEDTVLGLTHDEGIRAIYRSVLFFRTCRRRSDAPGYLRQPDGNRRRRGLRRTRDASVRDRTDGSQAFSRGRDRHTRGWNQLFRGRQETAEKPGRKSGDRHPVHPPGCPEAGVQSTCSNTCSCVESRLLQAQACNQRHDSRPQGQNPAPRPSGTAAFRPETISLHARTTSYSFTSLPSHSSVVQSAPTTEGWSA